MLKNQAKKGEAIFGDGTLEVLPDGFGFLRSPDTSYLAGTDDIYVSPVADPPLQPAHRRHDRGRDPHAEGRRALLRAGQGRQGQRRAAREREEQDPVREPDAAASGQGVQARARHQGRGEHHRPHHRHHRAHRQGPARPDRLAAQGRQDGDAAAHRARASPPTTPRSSLIVLLIDERPEEVTEMQRSVRGEVVASTFDEPATRHVQVAEMVIEKAKRLVEHKKDVVILLDSITRLARAYNTVVPASGKVLTGGVDANALQRPKRFFGAARNIEEGGSLTIIATALIDTGIAHGRRDLRGIQGHRQHGNPPRPPHGREAHLPGDQRQPLRHAPRGAADRAATSCRRSGCCGSCSTRWTSSRRPNSCSTSSGRRRTTPSSSTRCAAVAQGVDLYV